MIFAPYSEYKESGVEWLGKIPQEWEVRRLGTMFRQVIDEGESELPVLSVSIHDGVSDHEHDTTELDRKVTRSDDRSKYRKVQPGDLVYNAMRAWQGGFGAVAVDGMVSPAYVVARPIKEFSTDFVEQLLRTPQAVEEMRRHSHGVTDFRLRLYWQEFKAICIAVPPESEQHAIATFLDRETAKIDALVAEQRRLIELLKEKRQAVISLAVTKGLDPTVPMKDSGIDWLGEVPEHWDVKPLKSVVQHQSSNVDKKSVEGQDDVLLCNYTDVYYNEEITEKLSFMKATATHDQVVKFTLRAADVVITKDSETANDIAVSAYVPRDLPGVVCGYHLAILRPDASFSGRYLKRLFDAAYVKAMVCVRANGLTRVGLSQSAINSLPLPVPPIDEQVTIAEFVEHECDKISQLTDDLFLNTAILGERRTALISAAVTGKIDVRDHALQETA